MLGLAKAGFEFIRFQISVGDMEMTKIIMI